MATRKKGHDIDWSNVPRRTTGPAAALAGLLGEPAAATAPAPVPAPAAPTVVAPPAVSPDAAATAAPAAGATPVKPRTGPGYNALQIFTGNALQERIAELEEEVRRVGEQRGAVQLDARSIAPSRWANRHEASYAGKAYQELKAEIRDAGGNVQPVMVRPLPQPKEGGERFELVFGHRRHRACLELGLPVQAVVKEVDDQALFGFMERENRLRQNLSAWEQGTMYRRALDDGLFPSLRQLAAHVGRDHSDISKALRIAALPREVVNAFASPNDIQFRWAALLTQALEQDRAAVLRVAADPLLRDLPPKRIFEALLRRGGGPSPTPAATAGREAAAGARAALARRFDLGQGRSLEVRSEEGRMTLSLDGAQLAPEKWDALAAGLRKLLR
ncbi:ParB/RepB/Spo0J family partition protein [Azohydromonas aeria]|uniref:ParB/RepB/Spo0J family partition protein n=1 Tax=Azohydromonas aeria TaxID=2590212 RepID=UPI0012FC607A|nr:ParB/RepB/Spo0J family partition protein [Azohydromonas aeria]